MNICILNNFDDHFRLKNMNYKEMNNVLKHNCKQMKTLFLSTGKPAM